MASDALMLSISGLRGVIGSSLTPVVAAQYGAAIGTWLRDSTRTADPHIVLGRDSRPSGQMIEQAVVAGLVATGCRVTSLGIATTPGVAIMVEHLRGDGGAVITASHNPVVWNGIKALGSDGLAPPPEQAARIIKLYRSGQFHYAQVHALHAVAVNPTVTGVHRDRILPHIDAMTIRRRRPRVVLDSVHGAGGPETVALLAELGVDLVHLYAEPTGHFPHPPEPTAENLGSLGEAVRQHRADVGFAQDPDADRLAIVDENGLYIGEEYTLALCALHVLGRAHALARSSVGDRTPVVVTNLSTSRMLDDIAAWLGAVCVRTPVGEANVAQAMKRHGAVFGGEGNGGVILPGVCHVRNSLVGIVLVLEMLASRGESISQIVAEIPRYAIVKDKLPIREGMVERIVGRLRQGLSGGRADTQDGLRIDFEAERRWVHVRPSNTEPIIRLIAEAPTQAAARDLIQRCRATVEE